MMTGRMQTSRIVHVGRKVTTVPDAGRPGEQRTLYAPFCQRVTFRTVAYLGETHEEVTCTRCRRLMTSKPHLFA
jgi:hypothetical protein